MAPLKSLTKLRTHARRYKMHLWCDPTFSNIFDISWRIVNSREPWRLLSYPKREPRTFEWPSISVRKITDIFSRFPATCTPPLFPGNIVVDIQVTMLGVLAPTFPLPGNLQWGPSLPRQEKGWSCWADQLSCYFAIQLLARYIVVVHKVVVHCSFCVLTSVCGCSSSDLVA